MKFAEYSSLLLLTTTALAGCVSSREEPQATDRFAQLTDLPGDERHVQYSPDGGTIAFTHVRGGRAQVRIKVLPDGPAERLTEWSFEDAQPRWTPDGKTIAFQTSRDDWTGVWLADPTGGEPRRVTPDSVVISTHAWSPDGRWLAYRSNVGGSQDIWLIDVETGAPRQVTSHPGNEWHPSWSPDGKEILFYSTWDGAMTEVRTVNPASGEQRQVTDHPGEDYRPGWSPDGAWIAFVSNRGDASNLWLIPARGGEAMQLTRDDTYRDYLTWAPDGKSLAFAQIHAFEQLFTIDLAGGTPSKLSTLERDEWQPAVSPDGQRIAFAGRHEREMNLYIRSLSGTETNHLLPSNDSYGEPVWSPEGDRIAFIRNPGGGPRTRDLWTIAAQGDSLIRVTDFGGVRNAVWCAGATGFVYSWDEIGNYTHTIWRIAGEGGVAEPVVVDDANSQVTDCAADGRTILFSSNTSGDDRIYQLSLYGGTPRDMTPGDGARWSPDGNSIAFRSSEGGNPDLYVMASDGSRVTQVTDTEAEESWPSWSADGRSLVYSMTEGGYDIWSMKVELKTE